MDITSRKSHLWLASAAEKKAEAEAAKPKAAVVTHYDDGALLQVTRDGKVEHKVRMGPNEVHVYVTHVDGSITDLGLSHNSMTNIGRDVVSNWIGGAIPAGGAGSPATATSATSITATGTPWTASNLATPQLGLAGMRVYASVTGITTAPVYGNIIKNTSSVATIDQWWTALDGVGTTPASTNAFILGAGGIASVRFMGLTTDSGAFSAADTVLASEITTSGLNRQMATYAHTYGTATMTLAKTFTASGTFSSVQKMGLFCCLSPSGSLNDPMIFEATFSSVNLINGDQLSVTDTITVSG